MGVGIVVELVYAMVRGYNNIYGLLLLLARFF